jgi:hypothetical protein
MYGDESMYGDNVWWCMTRVWWCTAVYSSVWSCLTKVCMVVYGESMAVYGDDMYDESMYGSVW